MSRAATVSRVARGMRVPSGPRRVEQLMAAARFARELEGELERRPNVTNRAAGRRAHAIGASCAQPQRRGPAMRRSPRSAELVTGDPGAWPTSRKGPPPTPSSFLLAQPLELGCGGPAPRPRSRGPHGTVTPPPGVAGVGRRGRSTTCPSWSRRPGRPPRDPPGAGRADPDGATRRVSLHDPDARPIAKGRLESRWSSATRHRSSRATTASSS